MDAILTSPKPLNANEWFEAVQLREKFFKSFISYLVTEIAFQTGLNRLQVKSFIKEVLAKGTDEYDDSNIAVSDDEDFSGDDSEETGPYNFNIDLVIKQKTLIIRGIHFPVTDERLGFDYIRLFVLFPSLHFFNCHFYCESLPLDRMDICTRFETCTFHLPWQVEEGSGSGQDHVLFDRCRFEQGVALQGNELGQSPIDNASAFFRDCAIDETLSLKNMTTEIPVFANTQAHKPEIARINIENCELSGRFALSNAEAIAEIQLTSTVFQGKFALIHCSLIKLAIKNVNFYGLADFYQSFFDSLLIQKPIFQDFAGFEGCRFGASGQQGGSILLRYVTFYSFINFRGAQFFLPLDLRNTNRREPPNFLDCVFNKKAGKGTDRETFRIIKHSFEAVGNRIEANVFYALEMEAYRRELREAASKPGGHWRLWERLLVSLNFVLSRHGQSYWQPLLGVLICAAVIALQQANLQHGWLVWPESATWCTDPLMNTLNAWASGVIVLRLFYAAFPGHEAFILLMMVMLSTCIWHFLVATRRHHRG
jgi:hypothetical protein